MKTSLPVLIITFCLIMLSNRANAQSDTDLVSFEIPSLEIVIDTAGGNLWQIGEPQKTFFNSAFAGTKAILTDTVNYYPANDTSAFIYIIRNPYTQTCETCMEFWHKYDMDTAGDAGIIDASYDGGNSWLLLKDTFNFPGWSPAFFMWQYDYYLSTGLTTPHQLITSGTSDGWIKSLICWNWWIPVKTDTIIANPDSLMIRFTFISDSVIKNKEGWMIDEIVIYSAGWSNCSGIEENSNKEPVSVFPNPFSSQTTLQTTTLLNHATLKVYNTFGQLVTQLNNLSGQTITLYRDNLPAGLYYILLTENNRTIASEKLVISD